MKMNFIGPKLYYRSVKWTVSESERSLRPNKAKKLYTAEKITELGETKDIQWIEM